MIGDVRLMLKEARDQGRAVPALNIDSVDMAMAVIEAGESTGTGFVMQVTADTLNIWGWQLLTETLNRLIAGASVPVVLMLDHAKEIGDIRRAISMGYLAVMFDGSALPLTENIRKTKEVVETAHGSGCFVEGEVGHVARNGEPPEWEHLTSVDEARVYWNACGIDALAVAVGSKHGEYRRPEDINVERVRQIYAATRAPLVLHGGSGMPPHLLAPVIGGGIAKVNVGTELRRAWWTGIDASQQAKPREALLRARAAVTNRATSIIRQLNLSEAHNS